MEQETQKKYLKLEKLRKYFFLIKEIQNRIQQIFVLRR
jgi:hypothetical protein